MVSTWTCFSGELGAFAAQGFWQPSTNASEPFASLPASELEKTNQRKCQRSERSIHVPRGATTSRPFNRPVGKRGKHSKDSEDPKSSLRPGAPWRGDHRLVSRWCRGAELSSIRHVREARLGWGFFPRFDHRWSYVRVHPPEPWFCPTGRRIWHADRPVHGISRCL